MDFRLNDEQLAFQEHCHRFAADVIRPVAARYDQEQSVPWDVIREARNSYITFGSSRATSRTTARFFSSKAKRRTSTAKGRLGAALSVASVTVLESWTDNLHQRTYSNVARLVMRYRVRQQWREWTFDRQVHLVPAAGGWRTLCYPTRARTAAGR